MKILKSITLLLLFFIITNIAYNLLTEAVIRIGYLLMQWVFMYTPIQGLSEGTQIMITVTLFVILIECLTVHLLFILSNKFNSSYKAFTIMFIGVSVFSLFFVFTWLTLLVRGISCIYSIFLAYRLEKELTEQN